MKYHAYVYVNAADTCRDKPAISIIKDFGELSLPTAMAKCEKYIAENFLYPRPLSKQGDDLIAVDACSYGAVAIIEKVK